MNRKLVLSALGLALTAVLPAGAQAVWDLNRCIDHAVENRIDLRRQKNAIEASRIQVETAKQSYIPSVEANITPFINTGLNMDLFVKGDFMYLPASIEAHMPLFDLGISRSRKSAEYGLQAAQARMEQSKNDVAIAVTGYYTQAQYAKGVLSLAKDMVGIDRENLEYANSCLADGAIPESELTKARLALESSENRVIAAQGLVNRSLLELQHFINAGQPFEVDMLTELPATVNNGEAGDNWSDIVASQLELKSTEYALKAAKSEWIPKLSLNASAGGFTYNVFSDNEILDYDKSIWKNRTAAVWMNLNIPILQQARVRQSVRTAKVDVMDRSLAVDQTRQEYSQKIEQLRSSVWTGLEQDSKLNDIVETATANYRFEKERHEGGYGSWSELQEARKMLLQARTDQLDNLMRCLMDSRILDIYLNGEK